MITYDELLANGDITQEEYDIETRDERLKSGLISEDEYREEWLAEGEDRALTPPDDDW